jgi:hypothetical protein
VSVRALIDRIAPYAKGWSRTGTKSILDLIQQGQDELFDYDSPAMRFIPPDNQGFPPYLKTVDGTCKYDIVDANLSSPLLMNVGGADRPIRCRRVAKIFVDCTKLEYNFQGLGEPYLYSFQNIYAQKSERVRVAAIPIHSFPALENTNASIIFLDNPGTSADKYFCEFVWEPPRLLSENIPLVVPQSYEKALMRYVIGEIQFLANGLRNQIQDEFEKYWKPRFHSEMNYGIQQSSNETSPIIC